MTYSQLIFGYGIPLVNKDGDYIDGVDDNFLDMYISGVEVVANANGSDAAAYVGIEVATLGDEKAFHSLGEFPTEDLVTAEIKEEFANLHATALIDIASLVNSGEISAAMIAHIRDTKPRLLAYWGSF